MEFAETAAIAADDSSPPGIPDGRIFI